ncbi:uncharacterized protein LOC142338391 isoform X2 [Convolutriloba macropyga]
MYYLRANQWFALKGGYLTNVVDDLYQEILKPVTENSVKDFLCAVSNNFIYSVLSENAYFNTCVSVSNFIGNTHKTIRLPSTRRVTYSSEALSESVNKGFGMKKINWRDMYFLPVEQLPGSGLRVGVWYGICPGTFIPRLSPLGELAVEWWRDTSEYQRGPLHFTQAINKMRSRDEQDENKTHKTYFAPFFVHPSWYQKSPGTEFYALPAGFVITGVEMYMNYAAFRDYSNFWRYNWKEKDNCRDAPARYFDGTSGAGQLFFAKNFAPLYEEHDEEHIKQEIANINARSLVEGSIGAQKQPIVYPPPQRNVQAHQQITVPSFQQWQIPGQRGPLGYIPTQNNPASQQVPAENVQAQSIQPPNVAVPQQVPAQNISASPVRPPHDPFQMTGSQPGPLTSTPKRRPVQAPASRPPFPPIKRVSSVIQQQGQASSSTVGATGGSQSGLDLSSGYQTQGMPPRPSSSIGPTTSMMQQSHSRAQSGVPWNQVAPPSTSSYSGRGPHPGQNEQFPSSSASSSQPGVAHLSPPLRADRDLPIRVPDAFNSAFAQLQWGTSQPNVSSSMQPGYQFGMAPTTDMPQQSASLSALLNLGMNNEHEAWSQANQGETEHEPE